MESKNGIEQLKGKTITSIDKKCDELIFTCSDEKQYIMHHEQSCCESVTLDDIVGDLNDLIESPVIEAEEVSNDEGAKDKEYDESFTWTFYKIGTIKGSVTIKWYGTSNGYYSERVDFHEVGKSIWDED